MCLVLCPFTGAVTHYILPMDHRVGAVLTNPSGLDARVIGNPEMVPGILDRAIRVDGRDDYIQVVGPGHRDECFGDLDLCPLGRLTQCGSVRIGDFCVAILCMHPAVPVMMYTVRMQHSLRNV